MEHLQYFLWYGLATVIAVDYAARAYSRKGRSSTVAGNVFLMAGAVNAAYFSRIIADSYHSASVTTSVYYILMDLLLLSAFRYTMNFTGSKNNRNENKVLPYLTMILVVADAVLMLIGIFKEIVFSYHYDADTFYAIRYQYVIKPLGYVHFALTYAMVAIIILMFVRKTMTVPKIYRTRFTNSLLVLLAVAGINLFYVSGIWKIGADISVLVYGFMCPVIYWNSFDYTSKSVLNTTRKMVLEYMGTPLILFDYEGYVADSNRDMRKLFPVLNDHQTRLSMADFLQIGGFRGLQTADKDQIFEWKYMSITGSKVYQCKFICLRDEKNRDIGHLLILNNLEVERDMLTQLYSKQSFYSRMEAAIKRRNYPFTIVVCNANGIGLINDVYGWNKGNEMIRLTAELLQEHLPENTILARMDDGDIAAGFVEVEQEYAVRLFDNVCKLYREANDTGIESDLQYGIAVIRDRSKSIEEAIREAGESLNTKKLMNETSKKSSQLDSLRQTLTESDYETEEHVERTKKMAIKLGQALHLSDAELSKLALLAVLHDIGKIAIPHTILLKPGKLTNEEWEIMKSHTDKGYRIANASKELKPIAEYILHHHERWDGKGYPGGLDGENIPLLSRIITVVDSHDVMVHDRPYHKAMSNEDAVEELLRCSGTQFDPHIVTVFLQVLEEENKASDEKHPAI